MKKKVFKFLGIAIIASLSVFSSCGKPENPPGPEIPEELKSPSSLSIERPSGDKAILSWTGNGDSYEVKIIPEIIANEKIVKVTEPKYTVTYGDEYQGGLYSWEVRALRGDSVSEWVKKDSTFAISPPVSAGSSVEVDFLGEKWTAINIVGRLVKLGNETEGFSDAIKVWAEGVIDGYPTVYAEIPTTVGVFEFINLPWYAIWYYEKGYYTDPRVGDWGPAFTGGTLTITEFDSVNLVTSFEVNIPLIYMPETDPEKVKAEDLHVKFNKIKLKDFR